MRDLIKHPLFKAVLISGLVHGLFLWFSDFSVPLRPVLPLIANLQQGAAVSELPSLSATEAKALPVLPSANRANSSEASSDRPVLSTPSHNDFSRPAQTAQPIVAPTPLLPTNLPLESALPAAGLANGSAVVQRDAGEAVDADALRDYRFRLAKQARQYRRYPALARQRAWEGQVELALQFSPFVGGSITVTRSSSHDLLDKQAMEMIQLAFNATEMPPALKTKNFRLILPVDFRLDEH